MMSCQHLSCSTISFQFGWWLYTAIVQSLDCVKAESLRLKAITVIGRMMELGLDQRPAEDRLACYSIAISSAKEAVKL